VRLLTSIDRPIRDLETCRGIASYDRQQSFVADLDSTDMEFEGCGTVARHDGPSEIRVADSCGWIRACVVRTEDDFRVKLKLELRLVSDFQPFSSYSPHEYVRLVQIAA
jgi:hypothetical protein